MLNNEPKLKDWSDNPFTSLLTNMRTQGIVLTEIVLEYKEKNNRVQGSATGKESLKISSAFYDQVEAQTMYVYQHIFQPLIEFAKINCDLKIKVNPNGTFDLMNMEIAFHMDLLRGMTAEETLRRPLQKCLPFVEHIEEVEARGYRNHLTAFHSKMELSEEDLQIVLGNPRVVAPVARKQWYSIGSYIYIQAKETFNYHVNIPCFDGMLVWDNKDVTLRYSISR